jgi:hypothetical protein
VRLFTTLVRFDAVCHNHFSATALRCPNPVCQPCPGGVVVSQYTGLHPSTCLSGPTVIEGDPLAIWSHVVADGEMVKSLLLVDSR